MNQKITPFLWFEKNAEEAALFYISIFKNSKINSVNPMAVNFEIDGVEFIALNGGPQFKFTEAISFVISCDGQKEVDYYWEKLIADGGEESMCGWLKDKYGLSWQVVPANLGQLLEKPGATDALFKMKKIVVADLEN